MKKLFLAVLFAATPALADTPGFEVNKASFTATNDDLKQIQNNGRTAKGVVGVVVSSPTVGGLLELFDSRGNATSKIANVSLGDEGNYSFDVKMSSGLTYRTTINSSGVTIIYR